MHRVIERVYTPEENLSNFRRIANFLAPQYTGIYLIENGSLEETKIDIKLMSYQEENIPKLSLGEEIEEIAQVDLSPTSKLRAKMMAKRAPSISDSSETSVRSEVISKEIAKYEIFSLAKDDVDILSWWKSHESVLPELAKIAKSVLTIPCSSAKTERVFSCAGNFATKKRNKIGTSRLEDLVILKQNKEALKIFKQQHSIERSLSDSLKKIRVTTEDSIDNDGQDTLFSEDDDDDSFNNAIIDDEDDNDEFDDDNI